MKTCIVGHVGDGNFHTFISVNTEDPEEMKNYLTYSKTLIHHSLKLEGTMTGEHGIGLGKASWFWNSLRVKIYNTITSHHNSNKP